MKLSSTHNKDNLDIKKKKLEKNYGNDESFQIM